MSAKPIQNGDDIPLTRTVSSQPIIEVDCSSWESDIPESQWSSGKLVKVIRTLPAEVVGDAEADG